MKYIYQEIRKADGIILRGVINTPDDFDPNKKYPTAIFFHGFGGDRNGSTDFRIQHSQYLTDRGFVTIRFDFSGSGESDGSFYDMTVSRELEEAEMINDFAKLKYFVDKDRIYWIGHSLGGVIATLLAYKLKPKALVLLAPASDMNDKDYLKVMAKTMFEGEALRQSKIKAGQSFDELVASIRDADIGGKRLHINFLLDFILKDIYGKAKAYEGKVQILRGNKDALVFRDANEKLQKAFKFATYEEIDQADHSFTNEDVRNIVFSKSYDFLKNLI